MTQEDFRARTASLDGALGVGKCFDMTARDLLIAGRRARLWVVNGYAQEDVLERIIAAWQSLPSLKDVTGPEDFCARCVSASDAAVERSREKAVMGVFAGKTLLVVDGWPGGILMDVKQFPTRSIEEPDTSREAGSPLAVHADWIGQLVKTYGTAMAPEAAEEAVRKEIGLVFSHVLENAGVFKGDEAGQAAFLKFAKAAGLEEI